MARFASPRFGLFDTYTLRDARRAFHQDKDRSAIPGSALTPQNWPPNSSHRYRERGDPELAGYTILTTSVVLPWTMTE